MAMGRDECPKPQVGSLRALSRAYRGRERVGFDTGRLGLQVVGGRFAAYGALASHGV